MPQAVACLMFVVHEPYLSLLTRLSHARVSSSFSNTIEVATYVNCALLLVPRWWRREGGSVVAVAATLLSTPSTVYPWRVGGERMCRLLQ